MQKRFILIIFVIVSATSFSQYSPELDVLSKKEQRKLAREYRLSEKNAEAEKSRKITQYMVQSHRFILEADYISGKTGRRYMVNSRLNFIMLDSTNAVIQLGSSNGIGYNGVGGITIEGRITNYEITEKQNKKGTNYSITLYVTSSLGVYDIQIWVSQSGNADASVRGNYSGSVSYSGKLVPLGQSRVYKGMSSS